MDLYRTHAESCLYVPHQRPQSLARFDRCLGVWSRALFLDGVPSGRRGSPLDDIHEVKVSGINRG